MQIQIPKQFKPIFIKKHNLPYKILHTHDYWEFFIMLEGESVHNINHVNYKLTPNTVWVMRPEDLHCYPSGQGKGINISVDAIWFKNQCDAFSDWLYDCLCKQQNISFKIADNKTKYLLYAYERCNKYDFDSVDYKNYVKLLFLDVFREIYYTFSVGQKSTMTYHPVVSNIIKIMSDPENFSLTVEDVLSTSGYTHCHALRLFKQNTGITPREFFVQTKLDHARILLENTNMSIINIAQTIGFESATHFTSQYKKRYGSTPGEYRRNWINWCQSFEQ